MLNKDTTESPPEDESEELGRLPRYFKRNTNYTGNRSCTEDAKKWKGPEEVLKAHLDQTSKEQKHIFDHILKEEKCPRNGLVK